MSDTFPAARMADDQNTVQVDLAVERMTRCSIPCPKLLKVFEVNNRPGIVLAEVEAVEEVHVNRCRDDPMRCQQSAEIQVPRCGILQRVVITVRKHRERERASPLRHANMSIERHVRVKKWPRGARPEVCERRNIDSTRDVRRIRGIVDRILG